MNLDTNRLSGVGIGDSIQQLSFLGPASRWSYTLDFPHHGIAILAGDDCVEELLFYFGHSTEKADGAYRGAIWHCGIPMVMSADDTEQSIAKRFGEAYWRDADEDETILFYEFPGREWQLEFGLDARLKCLSIGRPLLGDPVQRQAYGVTKPWQPT